MSDLRSMIRAAYAAWAPPPDQTVSEWAEENFVLSPEYSAVTGPLKLYKFQRGPLDAYGDPYTREVVVMSATQMLKTLTLQVVIAHSIARDPGPILLAQPTATDAETFSKERISPMIRDMACLRDVVSSERKTSSANTIIHKVFRGGSLSLIGSQTPGEFSRRSIRVFLCDERDKWKKNVGKEGDGYSLGVKRTATFRSRAKVVQVCSPTIEGDSAIAAAYERSDQRKFFVPCPKCQEMQFLVWAQVRWTEDDPSTARYRCAYCDHLWTDVERWESCESEAAEWRATRPFTGIAGFWISELSSPWKRLDQVVSDFFEKKGDPETLQTFVNTTLAETWTQRGDAPPFERIVARAEPYSLGTVPAGVLFLTAGIDVHPDRYEVAVWGWGRGKQRWLVDYTVVEANTADAASWTLLTEAVNLTYLAEDGKEFSIRRSVIDTGYQGTRSSMDPGGELLYTWVRQQGPGRVLAAKGMASGIALLGAPAKSEVTTRGKYRKFGIQVWPVNVSRCKSELYGQIRLDRPEGMTEYPFGWVHVPASGWVRPTLEEFARQMVAEQFITTVVKGYKRGEWVNSRPGQRNEALDTANLARAGAEHCGISRYGERDWLLLEAQVGISHAAPPPVPTQPAHPIQSPPEAPRQQSAGWLTGNRGGTGWLSR